MRLCNRSEDQFEQAQTRSYRRKAVCMSALQEGIYSKGESCVAFEQQSPWAKIISGNFTVELAAHGVKTILQLRFCRTPRFVEIFFRTSETM